MFCTNCGKKKEDTEKFCTQCGESGNGEVLISDYAATNEKVNERWWDRLFRVFYITVHLPLLLIVPIVWSENALQYSSYYKTWRGSDVVAFWYSVLTIFFWLLALRLIKMAIKYIVKGTSPKFNDLLRF